MKKSYLSVSIRILVLLSLMILGFSLRQDGNRSCCHALGEIAPGCAALELYTPPLGGCFHDPLKIEIGLQAKRNGQLIAVVLDGKTHPLCSLNCTPAGVRLDSPGGSGLLPFSAKRAETPLLFTLWQRDDKMQIRLMEKNTRKTMILNTVFPNGNENGTFSLLHFKGNCAIDSVKIDGVRFSPLLQLGMIALLLLYLAWEEFCFLRNTLQKENDPVLKRLKFAASLLFFSIVLAFSAVWFHRCCGQAAYPYNTWLYWPKVRFGDFSDVFSRIAPELNVYLANVRGGNYFPLLYCLISPLALLKEPAALGVFLASGMAFYLIAPYCFFPVKKIRSGCWLLLLLICAYPVQITFDRANLEFLVYAQILLFAVAYQRKHYVLAALLLAAAINSKLYPGTLGVLFLADRRWREAGLTALFSLGLFLISAWITHCSWPLFLENLRAFNEFAAASCNGISFNHTLYGAARAIGFVWLDFPAERGGELQWLFSLIAAGIFCWVLWAVCFRVREYWERLFLLIGSFLLLPHFSFDYTLMHLMTPLFFFLFRKEEFSGEYLDLLGFVLLLMPMNFWQFRCYPEIQISVIAKPLLLLAMMLRIVYAPRKHDFHAGVKMHPFFREQSGRG